MPSPITAGKSPDYPLFRTTGRRVGGFFLCTFGSVAGLSVAGWPVTVDGGDTEFQKFLGDWVIQAAGNWTPAPSGTGNSSANVWGLRKAGNATGQILPLNSVGTGDPLAVSWEYQSGAGNNDVTFHVRIFGVNEGGATITNAGKSFGGTEGVDWAIIEDQAVTVLAADADSVWKTHAPAPITLTKDWYYIGLSFHYTGGTTNSSTLQQMDNFSIQVIPEPSSLLLIAASLLMGLAITAATVAERVTRWSLPHLRHSEGTG